MAYLSGCMCHNNRIYIYIYISGATLATSMAGRTVNWEGVFVYVCRKLEPKLLVESPREEPSKRASRSILAWFIFL